MSFYGIIKKNETKYKYGKNKRNIPFYKFYPRNCEKNQIGLIACKIDIKEDMFAICELLKFNEKINYNQYNVIKYIGPCSNYDAQINIRLFELELHRYKKIMINDGLGSDLDSGSNDVNCFSIDPEGCKDIDDAFSFDDDYFYVYISNPKLSPFDIKTSFKSSIYPPNCEPIHMIENFADGSLLPNQKRSVITYKFDIKTHDYINQYEEYITNKNTYNYDNVPMYIIAKMESMGFYDTHKWVAYWMVKVGRVVALDEKTQIYRTPVPDSMRCEYSFNKQHHPEFNEYYTHSTSPLRRLVDNLRFTKISNEDLQIINDWDKKTKKIHNEWRFIEFVHKNKLNSKTLKTRGLFMGEEVHEIEITLKFKLIEENIIVYFEKFENDYEVGKEYDLELFFNNYKIKLFAPGIFPPGNHIN